MSSHKLNNKYNNSLKTALILASLFLVNVKAIETKGSTQVIKESGINLNKEEEDSFKYIIGSGDRLLIDFTYLPEYTGPYTIGPTGSMYLPEIGAIKVEGLSIEGLINKLKEEYDEIIYAPEFNIQIVGYRPINAYITGEVNRPGKYTISGFNDQSIDFDKRRNAILNPNRETIQQQNDFRISYKTSNFPTLFDAIRSSGGITESSDLTKIQLTRKKPIDSGGGYMRTYLNILPELIGQEITESQNINILDGDIIKVFKADNLITEQMKLAMKSNINPSQILVFVSGQAEKPGERVMRNGSSLNQLLASSGGKKLFSGDIEFVRFLDDGSLDKRVFTYKADAFQGSYKNPLLKDGDLVNVKRSLIGYTTEAITTITKPTLGIFTLYTLFED